MQLNSIPVFIYNQAFFPFSNFIDWNDFCVLIHEEEIPRLKEILLKITPQQQQEMLRKGREIYNKYFTMEGMSRHILKTLQLT